MTRWDEFWDGRAELETDFMATGRSRTDVVGFLHTVAEAARLLDLGRDDDLLDVGCGTGLMMLAMAPYVRSVHGLDISEGMVERARRNLGEARAATVSQATIGDTGRPDASADKVLAWSVLQYLASEEQAAGALREVRRVLRPGGRALLAANPDPERRPVYEDVLREGATREDAQRSIETLDELLWLAPDRAVELAAAEGLQARAEPISPRIWQHFYMYDLVVEG